jgi:hypothetical protein
VADIPLPPVELPDGAVLLFEHMAVDDPDRTGNWRFYISRGGGFYQARNEQLFVDQEDLGRPDPHLYWNVEFPPEPQRRFDDDAMRSVEAAIATVDFGSGNTASPERVIQAERWTADSAGSLGSSVAVNGSVPPELDRLRRLIDDLVERSR